MYKQLDELKDEIGNFQRQQNSLLRGIFDSRPTRETADSMGNNLNTSLLSKGQVADNEMSAALTATLL